MIGDLCGICGMPIEPGQIELRVPHIRTPDSSVHALCPKRRSSEESK